MTRIEPRTLKGFRDLMPDQALWRARMVRRLEEVFRSHGFGPIETPALEYAEILKGKGGEEQDKEIFEFQDKGGRQVALRFDLTVPLARFVAEHQGELTFPFRRYHVGTAWRGERPQKGRFREFLQCDADVVGAVGAAADAEILVVMAAAYDALDVGRVALRVNDRRVLTGLLERFGASDKAVAVLRALDKREKQGEEAVGAEIAAAGVPAEAVQTLLVATRAGPDDDATLASLATLVGGSATGSAGVRGLRDVKALFAASGGDPGRIRIDPSIARGLDYYTGIVFEAKWEEAEGFGSVGSGGRYDDLAGLFTSTRLPGVGGSVGLDRILAALEETGRLPAGAAASLALVAHPGPERLARAFALAAALRSKGVAAEVYPEERKHAGQMKYADRKGIRFVLTVDEDGRVHGKDLADGSTFDAPAEAEAARAVADRVVRPG